jgi:hypothetical protein
MLARAACTGNINQLVLKASSYAAALERTQGVIAEFVNPKYKDASRTSFKSSTRLECMMQDFPHGLPGDAAVGFTVVNQARSHWPWGFVHAVAPELILETGPMLCPACMTACCALPSGLKPGLDVKGEEETAQGTRQC